MKQIITIGREFGAGGRTVGKAVAEKLGIAFYDRDLILKTAEQSASLTPDEVRKWEERVPHDIGFTQSLFDFYSRPLGDKIWDAQREAIRQIADAESCVIVGRNADYILREFDHLFRVFIYADQNWRIQHMKTLMQDTNANELEAKMISVDKARANYCTKYTGQVYGLANNYDLSINTGKFGIDKAVDLIISSIA